MRIKEEAPRRVQPAESSNINRMNGRPYKVYCPPGHVLFSKHPLILIKHRVKYSHVSIDTINTNFDFNEEGEKALWQYLTSIEGYIKRNDIYGAGRTFTRVTVRKEISEQVASKFLELFHKYKFELTVEGILKAAVEGRTL